MKEPQKNDAEPLPTEEYAQATGMAPVTKQKTPLQLHAEDEA